MKPITPMRVARALERRIRRFFFIAGSQERVRRAMKGGKLTRLNIGCQENAIPGWINVDISYSSNGIYMDATKPWPIASNSLDAILCEHMLEHVGKEEGNRVISEAFRALKPGGILRMVTPDVERFAKMCLDVNSERAQLYTRFLQGRRGSETSACDAINQIFYGYGHRYIYSPAELEKALARVGFTNIVGTEPGEPADPLFEDLEGHPKLVGHEVNAAEAFAMEARKP